MPELTVLIPFHYIIDGQVRFGASGGVVTQLGIGLLFGGKYEAPGLSLPPPL